MYNYNFHNTKKYTYKFHNTKHVHLLHLQFSQHNTKHVHLLHLQASQHKTRTSTLSTIFTTQHKTRTSTTSTNFTAQNTYIYFIYNFHNPKHVHLLHLQISQHKTFTATTFTIQNTYTYSFPNTKRVHIQLSQYKICTPTAFTTQNVCTYNFHNTKHLHLQRSQYKIYTPTSFTIQNMYTYMFHNTEHVRILLSNRYTHTQQRKVCIYILTMKLYLGIIFVTLYHVFQHIYNNFTNTRNVSRILLLRKRFLNFFALLQVTVLHPPVTGAPQLGKQCCMQQTTADVKQLLLLFDS
jgi:hypothetical protein